MVQKSLVAQEQFVTHRTRLRVLTSNERRMLLRCVRTQAGLGGKTFTTNIAVKRPVLGPLRLAVVISKVLLQVGQLNESTTTLGHMAFVGAFAGV